LGENPWPRGELQPCRVPMTEGKALFIRHESPQLHDSIARLNSSRMSLNGSMSLDPNTDGKLDVDPKQWLVPLTFGSATYLRDHQVPA
jgi:hypothetical protein